MGCVNSKKKDVETGVKGDRLCNTNDVKPNNENLEEPALMRSTSYQDAMVHASVIDHTNAEDTDTIDVVTHTKAENIDNIEMDSIRGHPNAGVSVHYLNNAWVEEVHATGKHILDLTNVYDISESIRAKGADAQCPRDGRKGAAYVDMLEGEDNIGIAHFMLSYSWAYPIVVIIQALGLYCTENCLDPKRTYIWLDCMCVNQHRLQNAEEVKKNNIKNFDQLEDTFGGHVTRIGHVLAVMFPWDQPIYIARAWCIYEMFIATCPAKYRFSKADTPMVEVIMSPVCYGQFNAALATSTERFSELWSATQSLCARKAVATVPADLDQIRQIIEEGPGFDSINDLVRNRIGSWVIQCSMNRIEKMLKEKVNVKKVYGQIDHVHNWYHHLGCPPQDFYLLLVQKLEYLEQTEEDAKEYFAIINDPQKKLEYESSWNDNATCPSAQLLRAGITTCTLLENDGRISEASALAARIINSYKVAPSALKTPEGEELVSLMNNYSELLPIVDETDADMDSQLSPRILRSEAKFELPVRSEKSEEDGDETGAIKVGVSTDLLKRLRADILEFDNFFVPNNTHPYSISEKKLSTHEATTADVVEQYIKPFFKGGAYCRVVKDPPQSATGPPNVFVSHAWKYKHIEVLDELIKVGEMSDEDCYFWVDFLVIDENDTKALPTDFWSKSFRAAIGNIGRTVILLQPWNDPIPLTRAWCLWEIFCTMDTGSNFDVLLTRSEQQHLKESVQTDFDVLTEAMMKVDAEKGEAYNEKDREMIFEAIRSLKGGFHGFNLTIKDTLRKLTLQSLMSQCDIMEKDKDLMLAKIWKRKSSAQTLISSSRKRANVEQIQAYSRFAFNIGRITQDVGDMPSALKYHGKALDAHIALDNPYSIACSYTSLGKIRSQIGEHDTAMEFLHSALRIQLDYLGMQYFARLSSVSNLTANELHSSVIEVDARLEKSGVNCVLGQFCLVDQTLDGVEWVLGVWLTAVASTFRGIGAVRISEGKYSLALASLRQALQIYQIVKSEGKETPYFKTVSRPYLLAKTLSAIGDVQLKQGNVDAALKSHEEACKLRETHLGLRHPSTGASYLCLGLINSKKKNRTKAIEYVEKAIALFEDTYGDRSLLAADAYAAMARVLMHDSEKALKFASKAENIHQQILGTQHPTTAESLADIGVALCVHGRPLDAIKVWKKAALIFSISLGHSHPISKNAQLIIEKLEKNPAAIKSEDIIEAWYTVPETTATDLELREFSTENLNFDEASSLLNSSIAEVSARIEESRKKSKPKAEGDNELISSTGLAHDHSSSFQNPCFAGDCLVQTPKGSVPIESLSRGDLVMAASGEFTAIRCVVVSPCRFGRTTFVEFPGGLRITPFHPVRLDGVWTFPQEKHESFVRSCERVYNLVLESEHIVVVNQVECVTLAHGFTDSKVVAHPYLGTDEVLNDLQNLPGWHSGQVTVTTTVRDPKTSLISRLGVEGCLHNVQDLL